MSEKYLCIICKMPFDSPIERAKHIEFEHTDLEKGKLLLDKINKDYDILESK